MHYPVNVKLVTQITKEVKARNVSGVSPFLVNFLRHTWVQIFLPPERIKRRNSKRKWTWMKITVFMTETPQLLVERLVRIFITFGDNDACFYHFLSEWGSDIKKTVHRIFIFTGKDFAFLLWLPFIICRVLYWVPLGAMYFRTSNLRFNPKKIPCLEGFGFEDS